MSQLAKALWMEGMAVGPQHFQHSDDYHEDLLKLLMSVWPQDRWGLAALSTDAPALARGEVRITRLLAVLRDGTLLTHGAILEAGALSRNFAARFSPGCSELHLHVGLPTRRPHAPAFGERPEDRPRYLITTRTRADDTAPERCADIAVATPNLALLLADELEGYDSLRIGTLARTATGQYQWAPNMPPCLNVAASPWLATRISQLLRWVSDRDRLVAAALVRSSQGTVELAARDLRAVQTLAALRDVLPELRAASETPIHVAPRSLHLALERLCAKLDVFGAWASPLELPRYDHDAPHAGFERLCERIEQWLRPPLRDRVTRVAMQRHGRGYFIARGGEEAVWAASTRLVLVVRDSVYTGAEQLTKKAKLAGPHDMRPVLTFAKKGVSFESASWASDSLPQDVGALYLGLCSDDPVLARAREDRALCLHLPDDDARMTVELAAIPTAHS